MVTVSVWVARVSGSSGSTSVVSRVCVTVPVSPLGVRTLRLPGIGASMPKRGSGPSTRLVTVPSGVVVVRLPSVPSPVVVGSPLGPHVTGGLVAADQGGEPARRVLVAREAPQRVVGELVEPLPGIGQRGQQTARPVGEARGLPGRVRDPREIALGVDRQAR